MKKKKIPKRGDLSFLIHNIYLPIYLSMYISQWITIIILSMSPCFLLNEYALQYICLSLVQIIFPVFKYDKHHCILKSSSSFYSCKDKSSNWTKLNTVIFFALKALQFRAVALEERSLNLDHFRCWNAFVFLFLLAFRSDFKQTCP